MVHNEIYNRKPPLYGPPPVSPQYRGNCTGAPDPNPYFPKATRRWWPQPPFWYQGDPCPLESIWPVGHPDDYKFKALPEPISGKTLLEEMEIERPERYLPGEIFRNERHKSPIEDLSKRANCQKIWFPKDPRFYIEFKPTPEMMNPPLLLDGVLARKAETINSSAIPIKLVAIPIKFNQSCEGVEDTETKNIQKPNYFELLKYANTRSPDYVCPTDPTKHFEDACKIPDTTVRVPESLKKKFWRPSKEMPIPVKDARKDKCDCGCK